MKKNIISAVLILLISFPVNAAVSESAGIIFPVLEIGAGARALAMGGAFVSVADDVSAVFWNPAGLASLKSAQIGIAYDKWFMDTFYSQTLFSIPMGPGSLGAEVVYVNLGSLDGLDSTGGLTGVSINPYNIGGCVSYGFSLNTDLAIGASLKFISQSTGTLSAAGYAADIGLLYRTKLFSAGIDLQNAGAGSGYSLPMNIRAGASFRVLNGPQHSLLAAMDLQYLFKASPEISIGVEYVYGGFTAIRAGYSLSFAGSTIDGLSGLSAGAGIILSGFKLDYAAVPYGELGLTHRVTLTYEFEQAKKKEASTKTKTQR